MIHLLFAFLCVVFLAGGVGAAADPHGWTPAARWSCATFCFGMAILSFIAALMVGL
jgi:hypothetical protein